MAFKEPISWKQVVDEIVKIEPESKAKEIDTSKAHYTEKDITTEDLKRTVQLLGGTQADLSLTLKQLLGKAEIHKGPQWYETIHLIVF